MRRIGPSLDHRHHAPSRSGSPTAGRVLVLVCRVLVLVCRVLVAVLAAVLAAVLVAVAHATSFGASTHLDGGVVDKVVVPAEYARVQAAPREFLVLRHVLVRERHDRIEPRV